jgi:hypothetical protein
MQHENTPPPVPAYMEPLLERVLTGTADSTAVQGLFGVSERELGILLRALIRQRTVEQQWEFRD